MIELVTFVAKALVDKPEEVEAKETLDGQTVVIELKVAPDDVGKIIGKQGRIAKALRTVVKAAATKSGKKVVVEITN